MVKLISLFPSFHPPGSPQVPWNSIPAGLWEDRHSGRAAVQGLKSSWVIPSFPPGLLILLWGMWRAESQGGTVSLLCITSALRLCAGFLWVNSSPFYSNVIRLSPLCSQHYQFFERVNQVIFTNCSFLRSSVLQQGCISCVIPAERCCS